MASELWPSCLACLSRTRKNPRNIFWKYRCSNFGPRRLMAQLYRQLYWHRRKFTPFNGTLHCFISVSQSAFSYLRLPPSSYAHLSHHLRFPHHLPLEFKKGEAHQTVGAHRLLIQKSPISIRKRKYNEEKTTTKLKK
jgi:hypothetical protein